MRFDYEKDYEVFSTTHLYEVPLSYDKKVKKVRETRQTIGFLS
jgi:hypothetical protein